TDELDFALDRGRFDGLLQRSAANIDDLIDASTTGQLSHREMPVGGHAVVDDVVGPEGLEALHLLDAGRGGDDSGSHHFRVLEREEGDAARAERENRVTR